jgi:hypothetical protein
MPTFHLQVLLAVTDDGGNPMGLDEPAWTTSHRGKVLDRIVSLHPAGDPLEVDADAEHDALERLFAAANVGGIDPDWEAGYRRRDRARSLSVGDVVVVNGETPFQCLSVGFEPLPRAMASQVAGMIDTDTWWGDAAKARATAAGRRVIITGNRADDD